MSTAERSHAGSEFDARCATTLAGCLGPLLIFNKNSKVAQADPDNPWSFEDNSDANGSNVVIHPVPSDCLYLTLWHAYVVSGASNPGASLPAIRTFGQGVLPASNGKQSSYRLEDISTTFPTLSKMWHALRPVNSLLTASPLLTFPGSTSYELDVTVSAKQVRFSYPLIVYVGGMKYAAVSVETIADQTGAGVICGIFN